MTSVQNASLPFADRRMHPRKNVSIGTSAILAVSDAVVDCTILDISQSGAKLETPRLDIVPARLKLFVPENDFIYNCEVVWRDGSYLGVKFAGGMSS